MKNISSFSIDSGAYERHLFEYRFNGAEWGFEIAAASSAEARERIKALAWAHYKGRILAKIPAPMGPLVRIGTFLRNVLGQRES
jgi:hypothetical protein